jgi:uncharacterized protein YoaH (UPF0181 family)
MDDLSEMFSHVVAHSDDTERVQDLMYLGFSADEATYIVMTANKLIDNYPSVYNTYNQAIRAAITILIQEQQQHQHKLHGGGRMKHSKPRKISRNKQTINRPRTGKRITNRTIKK